MRRILALGTLALLAGCADGGVPVSDVGPYPANYRDIVARAVRAEFFDPSSLQDVWIAPPYRARMIFTDGWMVCMRAHGKNRMGGYTGQQSFGYLIAGGVIVQEGVQEHCSEQQFVEWTEMKNAGWKH